MRIGLKTKLKKLESRRSKQRVNAVALEFECDAAGTPTDPEMAAWLSTPFPRVENAPAALLARHAGILNGRLILFPRFASEAAWEAAASTQQKQLLAVARSRTNKPVEAVAASMGAIPDDVPAPKRKGEKGKRYVELPDGRTFDRDTGEFEGG